MTRTRWALAVAFLLVAIVATGSAMRLSETASELQKTAGELESEKQRALEHLSESLEYLARLRALTQREIESGRFSPDSADGARLERNVESLDNEIDGLLIEFDESQLLRAAAAQRAQIPAARIRLLMAFRALDSGDENRALSLLKQARRHEMTAKDSDRMAQLERRLGIAPETEIAATIRPLSSCTGAATQRRPTSYSSRSAPNPWMATDDRCSENLSGSTIVFGVRNSRPDC